MNAERAAHCHSIVNATDVSRTSSVEDRIRIHRQRINVRYGSRSGSRLFCSWSLSEKTFSSASRSSLFSSLVPGEAGFRSFPIVFQCELSCKRGFRKTRHHGCASWIHSPCKNPPLCFGSCPFADGAWSSPYCGEFLGRVRTVHPDASPRFCSRMTYFHEQRR